MTHLRFAICVKTVHELFFALDKLATFGRVVTIAAEGIKDTAGRIYGTNSTRARGAND